MRLEHNTILTLKDTESMNIAKKSLIDFLEKKSGGDNTSVQLMHHNLNEFIAYNRQDCPENIRAARIIFRDDWNAAIRFDEIATMEEENFLSIECDIFIASYINEATPERFLGAQQYLDSFFKEIRFLLDDLLVP
jgi:hypothetical protein